MCLEEVNRERSYWGNCGRVRTFLYVWGLQKVRRRSGSQGLHKAQVPELLEERELAKRFCLTFSSLVSTSQGRQGVFVKVFRLNDSWEHFRFFVIRSQVKFYDKISKAVPSVRVPHLSTAVPSPFALHNLIFNTSEVTRVKFMNPNCRPVFDKMERVATGEGRELRFSKRFRWSCKSWGM